MVKEELLLLRLKLPAAKIKWKNFLERSFHLLLTFQENYFSVPEFRVNFDEPYISTNILLLPADENQFSLNLYFYIAFMVSTWNKVFYFTLLRYTTL